MKTTVLVMLLLVSFQSFRADNIAAKTDGFEPMYFPPVSNDNWESVTPSQLGWDTAAIEDLKNFLTLKNTKSFMILVNGKIAMEEYFNGHSASAYWQWNSAGKALTSAAIGIAQQQGLLDIDDKVSKYLGKDWSAESAEKEDLITIRNLLSMTSGLNDQKQIVKRRNLTYLADSDSRWSYSNVFQLLMKVIESAGGQDFKTYFDSEIGSKIGMKGQWKFGPIFKIYHSNTRSMARFGLLALNNGNWDRTEIINENYFKESISSSQIINPAYGYLWWLNGKSKFMLPRSQKIFNGQLIPNAPSDMYAALGAQDQKLYVIPSKKMVIVRMGNSGNPKNSDFASSGFDKELWDKINSVIGTD